ncbi:TRAM [Cavenderia fasciculata]|uniref:TRAM n=1 Tax=Cavenderia fasciculata TaxID=261658 RepID=F4Q6Z1_CACFS|nr:TRAM [Cavenderia fasciculata]EGG16173.1 TRAM [Cavenderia fasciculata]|eukprot:XP_004352626.1 TRAM [Cavenderia fasciculata]
MNKEKEVSALYDEKIKSIINNNINNNNINNNNNNNIGIDNNWTTEMAELAIVTDNYKAFKVILMKTKALALKYTNPLNGLIRLKDRIKVSSLEFIAFVYKYYDKLTSKNILLLNMYASVRGDINMLQKIHTLYPTKRLESLKSSRCRILDIAYLCGNQKSRDFVLDNRPFERLSNKLWTGIVSNLNAVLCTIGAIKCLFFDNTTWSENPFLGATPNSLYCLRFILGYFIYDTGVILVHQSLLDIPTLTHHLMALLLYYWGKTSLYCHFVLISFMFTEITTPCVNIRWFLLRTKKGESKAYIVNGMMMAFGFLIARVVYITASVGGALYKHYSVAVNLPSYIFWGTYVGYTIINVLNVYWAFLIWRGLLRAVLGKKSTRSSASSAVDVKQESSDQQKQQQQKYQQQIQSQQISNINTIINNRSSRKPQEA